jgi:carboxypeptidase PM20D1
MDDKGSAFAILEALEMLLQVEYEPQRTIYIALGHDEEVGGEHGAKRIAESFQQRGIEFEFILDEGGMVVENAMPGLEKPVAMIGVAEKGYATLELTVSLPEGGHSSMPPAHSAINILSNAIVRLRDHPSPAKMEGPLRDMLVTIGPEMGLVQKVIFANLNWTKGLVKWQLSRSPTTNAMLRSTIAPTMISGGFKENVLPARVSAKVNCRMLPGESVRSVMNHVYETIGDNRVVVSLSKSTPASEPPPVSSTSAYGYLILQTTIREVFPDAIVTPSLMIATTDSRHYQAVSQNIYRFLPFQISRDEIKRFHGIDERLHVEQYKQAVRFYRKLILNACK